MIVHALLPAGPPTGPDDDGELHYSLVTQQRYVNFFYAPDTLRCQCLIDSCLSSFSRFLCGWCGGFEDAAVLSLW
jgi:hypothetical protein